jgi:hypothetical protein
MAGAKGSDTGLGAAAGCKASGVSQSPGEGN